MKGILLFVILVLLMPVAFGENNLLNEDIDPERREELIEYLEDRDDYSDYLIKKMLKSQRDENLFILDRELGFLTTFEGRSFYVERVYENFQMHIFDIKTGKQLMSIPYISIQEYSIDEAGEFYIAVLEDGTIIKIPIFINESNFSDITITDQYGNPIDIQFSPIYSDFGIIGARLQLGNNVIFDYKNPLYGNSGVTIFGDVSDDGIGDLYTKEKFVLYMNYSLDLDEDDDEDDKNDPDDKDKKKDKEK